jgi:uncharacterized SAM-binding protein YcdF (DUF218 family)
MRRRRRAARLARVALVLAVAAAAAWIAGFAWFAQRVAGMPAPDPGATDAIVVLTGGSDRLEVGVALLAEGRARKLFVSGVHADVGIADLLTLAGGTNDALACCIVLGHAAGDTAGNARETAQWMASEGYDSLRLVTANYHMPRSLVEFRRELPDAVIVPHPVQPVSVHVRRWWAWPGTASLLASEYHKFLLARLRGLLDSG